MLDQALIVFFIFGCLIDLVSRRTATFLLNMCGKAECLRPAARILALVAAILKLGLLRVVTAMVELGAYKLRLAHCALEGNQTSPNLPIDVLPLYVLLVIHILNKAVQIKETVGNVLSYNLTVEINKDLGIGAHHPLILFACVQLPAIYTP